MISIDLASSSAVHSVIFIDPRVRQYETLVEHRKDGTCAVVLDANQDGLSQISAYLAQAKVIQSIHIVSHGADGFVQLGRTALSAATLQQRAKEIRGWAIALAPNASILLYGCNVAASSAGQAFVQQLAQLTGAEVAASSTLTGAAELGGNWDLDYATGVTKTAIAFQPEAIAQFSSVLNAFQSGNLVVVRLDNRREEGGTYGNGRAVPVFLDEYNPNTGLVQSIALPTQDQGDQQQLTLGNGLIWNGALSLSADGQYLTLGGLDQGAGNFYGTPDYTIALVDGLGNVDTRTTLDNDGSTSPSPNVATLDGTEFWVTGRQTLPGGGTQGAIWEATYGQFNLLDPLAIGESGGRAVEFYDNQLFVASDTEGYRPLNSVDINSATLPTAIAPLPGLGNINVRNAFEFVLLDRDAGVAGLDTAYVAALGGLYKYSFDGATWSARGALSNTVAGRGDWLGLSGVINGTSVDLYVVSGAQFGNSALLRVTDSAAFDQPFAATSRVIATAEADTAFRGVAFVPGLPTVSLETLDAIAAETETGNTATIRIRRSTFAGDMTVTLALAGNADPADYTLNLGTIQSNTLTVTIPGGQRFVDLVVTATPDTEVEGNETLQLSLIDQDYQVSPTDNDATLTLLDNRLPIGTPDRYTTDEDGGTLSIEAAQGVLSNDTDADGNPLQVALATGVQNGLLTLNSDGSFDYTPNANFSGTETFTYRINDGFGLSQPITVTITVNAQPDAPVAQPDAYSMDEDTVLTVAAATGILANDQDVDNEPLTIEVLDGVDNGTLVLDPEGGFRYTPDSNFNGTDAFSYQLRDPSGLLSNPVTVALTVNPVEDVPEAEGDRYDLLQGTTLTVDATTGVLQNDTDGDGDTLTAQLVTGPQNGQLTFAADGSFEYVPDARFRGVDQFTYVANDGGADSDVTTVTLAVGAVNLPPDLGQPIANRVAREDRFFRYRLPGTAFDDPDGDTLTYQVEQANGRSLPGWLRFNPNNRTLVGTPRNPHVGTLALRMIATDPDGETNSQTFQITVRNSNDAPRVGRSLTNIRTQTRQRFQFQVPQTTFFDVDPGDRLRYMARLNNGQDLPRWLQFNRDTLTFQGRAPLNAAGFYRIRVTARDRAGTAAFTSFALRVLPDGPARRPVDVTPPLPTTPTPPASPTNRIIGTSWNDSDLVRGTAGNDRINALGGFDYVRGFGGDDTLLGDTQADVLDGGTGNDMLIGGSGNDTLFGNQGRDLFVIGRNDGVDQVMDFEDGRDRIGLTDGLSLGNIRIVQGNTGAELRQVNGNALLMQLQGIAATSLTAADFVVF